MYIISILTPMGVDKKNIRTVIHLSPPSSVEAYLQESGRASRDGMGANAWLIWTPEDALGDHWGDSPENDSADRRGQAASEGDSGRQGDSSVPGGDGRSGETALEGNSGRQGVSGEVGASPVLPTTSVPGADAIAQARHAAMIRYASTTDRCRREMLLEALGIEAQDCTGCDICGGEAWTVAPEREVILKVVRWNRGRFRKGQLARILVGRRTAGIRRTGLDLVRGFGALAGWELEDAEEAISVMTRTGSIRKLRLSKSAKLRPPRTPGQKTKSRSH